MPHTRKASGALTPAEAAIVAHVRAHMEQALSLLGRVVEINSGTMNHPGVEAVAEVFRTELEPLGLRCRWQPLGSVDRAGHLIAERTAIRGARLLLIGHLDTVFPADSEFRDFSVNGRGEATGPGTQDMKGGDVVLVQALRALHATGALEDATVRVILTGDEEDAGRPLDCSRGPLLELARGSDVALGFESGARVDGTDRVAIARRGATDWTLECEGQAGHSSLLLGPEKGAGAVFEAARVLEGFRKLMSEEDILIVNPSLVLGGSETEHEGEAHRGTARGKTNVIPAVATVQGGVRYRSDEQLEQAKRRMQEIAEASLPCTRSELRFDEGYPAMASSAGNRRLLARFDRVSRDLGHGPVDAHDPGARGAADISFVAPMLKGLDGLGPIGEGEHSSAERIDLDSYARVIERAAIFMYRLLQDGRGR